MIRYLRLLLLGLLGLGLLTVALANRAPVMLQLLPTDLAALTGLSWAMELPLFVVIFGGIAAGKTAGFGYGANQIILVHSRNPLELLGNGMVMNRLMSGPEWSGFSYFCQSQI